MDGDEADAVTTMTTQRTHKILVEKGSSPCLTPQCRCSRVKADCSRNKGNLTYIPELPRKVRRLVFSFNDLLQIPHDDFFLNATNITNLDLSHNCLAYISPGAFSRLTRLKYLHLDYNKLTYNTLTPVFACKSLTMVFLRFMNMGPMPDDFLVGNPWPSLTKLDLTGNAMRQLNLSAFQPLLNLKDLRVPQNQIIKSTVTSAMTHLESLSIHLNGLFDFPQSCADDGTSLLPKLSKLVFTGNRFEQFSQNVCLPALESLSMGKNLISVIEQDMFGEQRFPKLRGLTMDNIQDIKRVEQFAFRSPSLRQVSLMYNNIRFSDDTVNPDCFAGSPALEYLQLSHNFCQDLSEEKFARLFGAVRNLRTLFLGQCELRTVTRSMMSSLSHQTYRLFLYRNKIDELPDGVFDDLNLTTLVLGANQIRTIRETTFGKDMREHLHSLDLGGNPFSCDCDLRWFRRWFGKHLHLFPHKFFNYTCKNLNDSQLLLFHLNDQACILSHETSRAVIASVVVFIGLVQAACIVYHFRWHIRLMLAFRGRHDVLRRRLEEGQFQYDVYVSSAEEDLTWVEAHLMPKLEEEMGLRLCVNERDFHPGKRILDNIVDCVGASKKYMLVFSKNFSQSPWCQFELDMCLTQAMEEEDVVVVVCLQDLPPRHLSGTMTAVLKTTTHLQWREGPDDMAMFWRRVTLSLGNVLP